MAKESRKFIYQGLLFVIIWNILSIFLSIFITNWLKAIIPEQCTHYQYVCEEEFGICYDVGYNCKIPIEIPSMIISIVIKFLVWTLFGLYFIKKYNQDLEVKKDKLFKLKNIKFLIILVLTTIVGTVLAMLNNHGGFNINEFTIYDFIDKFLIIGVEELVFRGLILNGLMRNNKFYLSSFITSALFVLVHVSTLPQLLLDSTSTVIYAIKLFGMSLIFDYIFKSSKSIWHVTIFHSLWDLLFYLFVE